MKSFLMLLVLFFSVFHPSMAQENGGSSNRYAVVVGISSNKNHNLQLNYSAKDAEDFQKALLDYGNFKKDNIKLLTNEDATRENIRKNIEGWLKKVVDKNSFIIIYFSGHGTQVIDTDGDEDDGLDECLVPYDVDVNDESSLITDDTFAYWVRNLASQKILIVFDNCFSGGAAKQKAILMPGIKGGKAKDDFYKDIYREVPLEGTTALFAASKPDQVSFESPELGNGLFTHFLIQSISSSTDNNFNRIIDVQELFYATRILTLKYAKDKFKKDQEPVLINTIKDELGVFYLPVKTTSNESSQKIKNLLYRARHEDNWDNRIALLKEVVKIDQGNLEGYLDLAFAYESKGNYTEALRCYEYLNSIDLKNASFSPPISSSIARIYERMGNIDKARIFHNEALKQNPRDHGTYFSLGMLDLKTKDTSSAIQNFNKAIEIEPLQKECYLRLFDIYYSRSEMSTAFAVISNCYQINPDDFQTIYWYGSFQKYYVKNIPLGDSLLTYFEKYSGIARYNFKDISFYDDGEILKKLENGVEVINVGVIPAELTQFDSRNLPLSGLEYAIKKYPYYADFQKQYIRFAAQNKKPEGIDKYIKSYIKYSRLNPDNDFIKHYIK